MSGENFMSSVAETAKVIQNTLGKIMGGAKEWGYMSPDNMDKVDALDDERNALLAALWNYRSECPCESGSINRTPCDFCVAADKAFALDGGR